MPSKGKPPMPAELSENDDRGGTPNWATYVMFSAIAFAFSMVGGCINRQEARQRHEQYLGKMEEIRQEVIARRGNR